MKYFLKIFHISTCLFLGISLKITPCLSEDLLDINLQEEIKNGKFLIGLKQYLGANKKNEDFLHFKTENNFLTVKSSNGLRHESKEIKIILKRIPLKKPLIIERLISKSFASYESAKRESQILEGKGYNPVITMPNKWVLWLPLKDQELINNGFQVQKKIIKQRIVPYLTNQYTYQKLDGNISINSKEDIQINGINYGKNFYLIKDSYGSWTLIQKISFDKYLSGVLPHEIGANSPIESLKAQAVIARTWAIFNSNRFKSDNFHLCITTQCQVYKPTLLNQNIKQAIKDTENEVLVYEDQPINAFYHASNGGISANASESWKIKDYPYLSSKKDLTPFLNNNNNKVHSIKTRKELLTFLQKNNNDFFGKDHYLFRWKKNITSKQINDLLIKNKLSNKGLKISNIKVVERGLSGRVTKILIRMNSQKLIILEKDDIRKSLNFLPSNLFIIDKLNDNLWVFNGGGFGHGVGLSQAGAIEMAKTGITYQKILSHYYKGAKIFKFLDLIQ